MRRVIIVAMMICLMGSTISLAQTLSIQGVLRDATGASVPDATKNFTFRLYTVATGGTKVWDETQAINVINGVYSATLGVVNSLAGLNYDVSYWLGISVDGAEELTPRTKLTLSPYAILAGVSGTTNVFPQSGNVGIGRTNPDKKLVVSDGTTDLKIIPGMNDNTASADYVTIDIPGTKTLRVSDNLMVSGLISANSGLKVGSAGTVIKNSSGTDGRPIMTTGWNSTFGDFTAILSGYDHDGANEPVSVVAGAEGVQFTKATSAGVLYGETMMKVGKSDIDMKLPVKVDGNKPIIFKRLNNLGDDIYYNTGYSYETYTVGIVGFRATDGDINENNAGDIIQVYAYKDTGTKNWWIHADFRSHNNSESWYIDLIVVNNKLCDVIGY